MILTDVLFHCHFYRPHAAAAGAFRSGDDVRESGIFEHGYADDG